MLPDIISRLSEGFFNGALKLGWHFAPASTRVIGHFLCLNVFKRRLWDYGENATKIVTTVLKTVSFG